MLIKPSNSKTRNTSLESIHISNQSYINKSRKNRINLNMFKQEVSNIKFDEAELHNKITKYSLSQVKKKEISNILLK